MVLEEGTRIFQELVQSERRVGIVVEFCRCGRENGEVSGSVTVCRGNPCEQVLQRREPCVVQYSP